MRAQALEKLLEYFVDCYNDGTPAQPQMVRKAEIVLENNDNRAASVIREVVNNGT